MSYVDTPLAETTKILKRSLGSQAGVSHRAALATERFLSKLRMNTKALAFDLLREDLEFAIGSEKTMGNTLV